jgi:hypothetical protein
MKFFRLDLLTLLISLFILNSCKNQDNIGLGVNSVNQINGSLIDTSTVVINTIADDTVTTSGLTKTPLSYFKDPVFGTTEANMAMDLNLPGSQAYVLPPGDNVIDSAILVLPYADGFSGDSLTSRYKANVYQLNERLLTSSTYLNTKKWAYNSGSLLGTQSFFSRTHDTIKITNPVPGKPDTLVKVRPQLRIPISKAFINSILFNAPAGQLASNLVFKNTVKGLYVTLDKNQTGPGGTFLFALGDSARVDVYYKATTGTIIDTAVLGLPITLHAAEIKHTYTPQIQTELSNTTTSRKTFYLQGLAGLRARVAFPYIKNIVKTLGSDIILNRAELVITPVPGSTIPFAPMSKISMYKYDLAHQRVLLEDANSADPRSFAATGGFGGYYLATPKEYHFLVTAYVQNIMRGVTKDFGTFIGAGDGNIFSLATAASPEADGRTIAVGSDASSPYRIKLNIFYTKIAK